MIKENFIFEYYQIMCNFGNLYRRDNNNAVNMLNLYLRPGERRLNDLNLDTQKNTYEIFHKIVMQYCYFKTNH